MQADQADTKRTNGAEDAASESDAPAAADGQSSAEELRRLLRANRERTTYLLVAAAVWGVLVAVTVGVAGRPAPLLPRQVAVTGGLAIGPPTVYLLLTRAAGRGAGWRPRQGLALRALRFGVPAGAVAAAATVTAYTLTGDAVGGSRAEARTVSAVTLFLVALWVVAILTRRPGSRAHAVLVASVAVSGAAVMAVPPLRELFAFELTSPLALVTATGVTVVATVATELAWQVSGSQRG